MPEKKPRNYQREVELRKQREAARKEAAKQEGGGIAAKKKVFPPKQEKPKEVAQEAPETATLDIEQCGHVDVPLSQIVSDPNQPRKFFDMVKLVELSKTIVQHGVIEPILIRPISGGLFMIVFGERRFRGSLLANEAGHDVTHIPAMIKELTDEQALEIQLVENLHRSDPHPIEDAFTFKKMLEKHSVEEIALRIGKSTKFVSMRMMLCDLSPDFQEVFFANKMSLGQAVTLCKVSLVSQAAIFEDEVPHDWKEDQHWILEDIERFVNREQKDLNSAPFNIEDHYLYAEMGACSLCKFNSKNNLVLFIEESGSQICGDSHCFNIKCARAYTQSIEKVMEDPAIVFVAAGHYDDVSRQKVKDVEKMGVPVLPAGTWKKVSNIEGPGDWAAYLAKQEDNFNPDAQTRDEFEAWAKEEYDEEVTEYQQEIKDMEEARAGNKIRKAFVVAGNMAGTIVDIMPTSAQGEIALAGGAASDLGVANAIAEIEKREERAKELDAEKVWTSVREAILSNNHLSQGDELKDVERGALAAAIYEAIGWNERKIYAIDVLKLEDYDDNMQVAKALEAITDEQMNQLSRVFMRTKLFPLAGSQASSYINYMGYSIAKAYIPVQVADIEANQKVKAVKRAENVKKKIRELKDPKPEKEKKGEE